MTNIKLSPRLSLIASYVPPGKVLADVGCDHGWLGLKLLSDRTIPYLIGMDLREGPLEGAKQHAADAGLSEYTEFRLSDGLDAFRAGEASTLVIAGMGGKMMAGILSREPDKTKSFTVIIAEPQKDHALVRRALAGNGFVITDEKMTVECGKYYPVIRAERRPEEPEDREISPQDRRVLETYGPVLIRRRDPVLREYLEKRLLSIHRMLDSTVRTEEGETAKRRSLFEQECEDIDRILALYRDPV